MRRGLGRVREEIAYPERKELRRGLVYNRGIGEEVAGAREKGAGRQPG